MAKRSKRSRRPKVKDGIMTRNGHSFPVTKDRDGHYYKTIETVVPETMEVRAGDRKYARSGHPHPIKNYYSKTVSTGETTIRKQRFRVL